MPASSDPQEMMIHASLSSSTEIKRFADVLVGEVWFCSGQSNMQMPLEGSGFSKPVPDAPKIIADSIQYPTLRLYNTPRTVAKNPIEMIDSQWTVSAPETAGPFSATAYFFGRKLNQDLGVPVGLLLSCWGATRIEPWIPSCGFEGIPSLATIYQQSKNIPEPKGPQKHDQYPSILFNSMISAHIPYVIRGAIWYQGESGHKEGAIYIDKTKALLNGWRKLWGYEFPFYFVQIAPFQYGTEDPELLPIFWEAQSEIPKQIPNTGMVVASDATQLDSIHPINKQVPGERLALLAEDHVYDMDVVSSGPVFQTLEKSGNQLTITFSSAKGLTTRDGHTPDWFEIAGSDGIFKSAEAEIVGNRVILRSPEVPSPQAMRFAWNKTAIPNLINGAGLPTSAFRTGELPSPKTADPLKIPEMDGYRTVYRLEIPSEANYAKSAPQYETDNSENISSFTKIAYVLELQKAGSDVEYTFVSMDAFTDDVKKTGLPVSRIGVKFMQKVSNLTVRSNVDGIVPCTDSDGGNIEFWPNTYTPKNAGDIPGASPQKYDFGDAPGENLSGYGCMQVHNWKDQQTVFAINHWGCPGTVDIGIGNSDGKATDWTFAANAEQYSLRRLTVMVK